MKQREIKFRAWDKAELYMTKVESFPDMMSKEPIPNSQIKNMLIMQFTGLNANSDPAAPIYEGDIYKSTVYSGHPGKWDRFIGQVVFQEPAFKLKGIGKYEGRTAELHALGTILGNIYENPELLTPSGHD